MATPPDPTPAAGDPPTDPAACASWLGELVEEARRAGRWNELLELRLIQARAEFGAPVDGGSVDVGSLDGIPDDARRRLEERYTAACEASGLGLLEQALAGRGGWRDAWFYLNTAGQADRFRAALRTLDERSTGCDASGQSAESKQSTAFEQSVEGEDELLEVTLHEGADPAWGFRRLITGHGACPAVTTLEGLGPHLPLEALSQCAGVLVEHLHGELLASVRAHVEEQTGAPHPEADLPDLIAANAWLFEGEASHVDSSHLAAAVRMARVVVDPALLDLAEQLAAYGRRLAPLHHYPDAPPFEEIYDAHREFFAAQLPGEQGRVVDAAVERFTARADAADPEVEGLAPLETLLVLLHRIGRPAEALAAYARLAPVDAELSPYAPRPLDLARASGDWSTYEAAMRSRGDLVGLAQGAAARAHGL